MKKVKKRFIMEKRVTYFCIRDLYQEKVFSVSIKFFPFNNNIQSEYLAAEEAYLFCEHLNKKHEEEERLVKAFKKDIKRIKRDRKLRYFLELDYNNDIYLIDRKNKWVITSFSFPETQSGIDAIKFRCLNSSKNDNK